MRWLPWGLVLASLALLPVLTPAAPKQNEPAGEVMYRYTKPDGTLAVSATLNEPVSYTHLTLPTICSV